MEPLFPPGSRVRICTLGEHVNGTLDRYLFQGQVAVVKLDDGRTKHVPLHGLSEAVDE